MPSRNVLKVDVPDSFYHVYARGHGRRAVFKDDEDYRVFLNLFKRHLDIEPGRDRNGREYKHLRDDIELNCFCVLPNHFHLLLYQQNEGAMQQLMRSIMTAYGQYFNKKYDSSGSVFESTYKASMITVDEYLMHISRYIHLNPQAWKEYRYSSLGYYLGELSPAWLRLERILELFSGFHNYREFIEDYEDYSYKDKPCKSYTRLYKDKPCKRSFYYIISLYAKS